MDIMTEEKKIRSYTWRGMDGVKEEDGGGGLFYTAKSFTLLEYMLI